MRTRRHYRSPLPLLAIALITVGLAGCKPATPPEPTAATPGPVVVAERKESDKLNAYVEAYNRLHQFQSLSDMLGAYQKLNPQLSETSEKGKAALDRYAAPSKQLGQTFKALDEALAIEVPMPELDAPAKALKTALDTLDPLLKEAMAYGTSKEYLSDKGVKARAMDGPLVAAVEQAMEASSALGAALSKQTLKRDEARLGTLTPGTVAYHKLKVSLAARQLSAALKDALIDASQSAAVTAPMDALVAANAELGALKPDPKAAPAWDALCATYKGRVDSALGCRARADAGPGGGPGFGGAEAGRAVVQKTQRVGGREQPLRRRLSEAGRAAQPSSRCIAASSAGRACGPSQAITWRCGMLRSQVICRLASWRVAAIPRSGRVLKSPLSSASQAWR